MTTPKIKKIRMTQRIANTTAEAFVRAKFAKFFEESKAAEEAWLKKWLETHYPADLRRKMRDLPAFTFATKSSLCFEILNIEGDRTDALSGRWRPDFDFTLPDPLLVGYAHQGEIKLQGEEELELWTIKRQVKVAQTEQRKMKETIERLLNVFPNVQDAKEHHPELAEYLPADEFHIAREQVRALVPQADLDKILSMASTGYRVTPKVGSKAAVKAVKEMAHAA